MRETVGTLTPDEVKIVVDAYESKGSLQRVSLQSDVPFSFATIQRVISWADSNGLVEKKSQGRPKIDRKRIFSLRERYPGLTVRQIARIAECSETTIYRAKASE